MSDLSDRTVVLAGATSASGHAAARALVAAGARVIAVGRSSERLEPLRVVAEVRVCDLENENAVRDLAAAVGDIDGLVHLVGGWRGGGGLSGQSDADYRAIERSLTALRHVSRAFDEALRTSRAGREVIVSSAAVERPLAGGANYAAVTAAREAWARAVAHGFAKAARDAGQPLRAASVIFRVKTLEGHEAALAEAIVGLWHADAADVNDTVQPLSESTRRRS